MAERKEGGGLSYWMCWRRSPVTREEELRSGMVEMVELPMLGGTDPSCRPTWAAGLPAYTDMVRDIGGLTTDTRQIHR